MAPREGVESMSVFAQLYVERETARDAIYGVQA